MCVDYVGIVVALMGVCAIFVTVSPVISTIFNDKFEKKFKKQEDKINALIEKVEKHEKEIETQKESIENINNIIAGNVSNIINSFQKK
jgi:peptidoglycan hydrolase CwlO-like protein